MITSSINIHWLKLLICLLVLVFLTLVYYRSNTNIFSPGWKTLVLQNGREKFIFEYKILALLEGTNQARISSAKDPDTRDVLMKDDFGLFHIVTTFVPFDNTDIRKNLLLNDDEVPTDHQIEARMAEVTDCLQRNLNNKMIAYVHTIVFREETINYLQSLDLENSQKLIIHKNEESPTMLHEILYATKYLQGKIVIVSHQDNYIGEGWEQVNHDILRKEQLMYALTRHPSPLKCSATTTAANCGGDYPYMGSHDTFVFYVNGSLARHKLVEIDVTPNMSGIENVLIWIFKTRFNYRVLNPCKVLKVYHSHCVSIREMGRERINVEGKNALVHYTDQLQ